MSVVRLREGAVPSIFDFPVHLQPKDQPKRKPPKNRHVAEDIADNIEENVSASVSTLEIANPPITESPTKELLKRKQDETNENLERARKKIKLLHQTKRRLKKKNAMLHSVIEDLRKKSFISEQSLDVLQQCSGGISDLLKRQPAKLSQGKSAKQYSPALRSFAMTLNFYSPRAYKYVRTAFDTRLPHPRTLDKWYHSVEIAPGFTEPSFLSLKSRVDAAKEQGKETYCALVMDEVAIRQHVEWDGKNIMDLLIWVRA